MTTAETELDILNCGYLIGCAGQARDFPEELRTEQYRIKDCQGLTWAAARWEGDAFFFRGDSDSLIVKGGLALLEELYDGRSRQELAGYQCGLLRDEAFAQYFTPEQQKGLEAVLAVIAASSGRS